MSRGPGTVERAITDLFRASGWSGTDRTFTVEELCREVFGVAEPTRAHRVSVARAARTAMRRARAARQRQNELRKEAEAAAVAKFGERKPQEPWLGTPRDRFLDEHPATLAARCIPRAATALARWRATVLKDRSLIFHHNTRPVRVWAVEIIREGLVWSEAEIVEITPDRISVRYHGKRCPLQRPLGVYGSWWRGVRFVGERDGWTAERLEGQWREQFGHTLATMPMPLELARQLLGLGNTYDAAAVIAAFRKAAKRCHPDVGGTAEQFRALVEARDRLLAALGTSAPPPKEPDFTPVGFRTVYRTVRNYAPRIGGGHRLLAG